MTDLFPAADFDDWAESYDASVVGSRGFPFEGYDQVLDTIVGYAAGQAGMKVLELGTGTGLLAGKFDALGCRLWGTDFSQAMLQKARARLPQAHFLIHDLRQQWPAELNLRFDRIVSGYVFHHFEDGKKVELILDLVHNRLAPGGKLVIGDIGFETLQDWQAAEEIAGSEWEKEFYWTASWMVPELQKKSLRIVYKQVSFCAGVYCIELPDETRKAGMK